MLPNFYQLVGAQGKPELKTQNYLQRLLVEPLPKVDLLAPNNFFPAILNLICNFNNIL